MTAPADTRSAEPDVLTADDHARGCAGREYACTCGYDERVADEIRRLRARVEALEGALRHSIRHGEGCSDDACWDGGRRDRRCKCNRLIDEALSANG